MLNYIIIALFRYKLNKLNKKIHKMILSNNIISYTVDDRLNHYKLTIAHLQDEINSTI